MYFPGDLVQVNTKCSLRYFIGQMGVVTSKLGKDDTMTNEDGYHHNFDSELERELCYFNIRLSGGHSHIFSDRETDLISKGRKNK